MLNLVKKYLYFPTWSIIFAVFTIIMAGGVISALAVQAADFFAINNYSSGIDAQLVQISSATVFQNGNNNSALTVYPLSGSSMLRFNGSYNSSGGNDYAYWTWRGGEENNYQNYQIRSGDVLAFSTLAGSAPGCGVDIDFTDGSHLRWNHYDQDGISILLPNPRAFKQWQERRTSLSDLAGKTIASLNLAQENEQPAGASFECYFDNIRIVSQPPPAPAPTVPGACADTDGLKNFYTKGSAYGWSQQGNGPELKWWSDYCIGDYVYDFTCKKNINASAGNLDVWADSYKCPNGCSAGACLNAPQSNNNSWHSYRRIYPSSTNIYRRSVNSIPNIHRVWPKSSYNGKLRIADYAAPRLTYNFGN